MKLHCPACGTFLLQASADAQGLFASQKTFSECEKCAANLIYSFAIADGKGAVQIEAYTESEPPAPADDEMMQIRAADDLMNDFPARADLWNGSAPLYHGWVIREAFMRGVQWARNHP